MTSSDGQAFRYGPYELDADATSLTCHYELGGRRFTEHLALVPSSGGDLPAADAERVDATARLVHLLAGISYYKTSAPRVVDLGSLEVSLEQRALLHDFYVEGLGEFAFRNELDLTDLELRGGRAAPSTLHVDDERSTGSELRRALVPFGGGIDSIVTVEEVRRHVGDTTLFVVQPAAQRFAAIETPAAVSRLPVLRVTRRLDPQVLRSQEHGFLNGHIPVTGILSAIAMWVAARADFDAVVMSNEWSASSGNLTVDGRSVNHQYSKSARFEDRFRRVASEVSGGRIDFFSFLRSRSELWVAQHFAELRRYHRNFRSCNRAFHIDPRDRMDRWCGTCDKCCFIDLILSPFMARDELQEIFDHPEPLENPALASVFETLLGLSGSAKPFECVGDIGECRAAVALAAARTDRRSSTMLQSLARSSAASASADHPREPEGGHPRPTSAFLGAMGPDHVPADLSATFSR